MIRTKIKRKSLKYTYKESIKRDGFLNIFVYRKISLVFAVFFSLLNYSPNHVTILSLAFTLISSTLFLSVDRNIILLGLIPFHTGKILDCADGQLAILINKKTKMGEFLDPFADRVGDIAVLGALSYSHFSSTGNQNISYLFVFLIVILYISSFLDSYCEKLSIFTEAHGIGSVMQFFPLNFRKYVRWDGGFSAIFITFFILIGNIPLMIAIYIFIYMIPLFFKLIRIINTL